MANHKMRKLTFAELYRSGALNRMRIAYVLAFHLPTNPPLPIRHVSFVPQNQLV